jgi:preprotein translocase subunit YajC
MILNSSFTIIGTLLAQAQGPQDQGDQTRSMIMSAIPFLIIFAIFYFVLIRPQQKQQKDLKKQLDVLKSGDRVLTVGGIFGVVSQVKDKSITVKIAENTKIEMLRSGIQQIVNEEAPKA